MNLNEVESIIEEAIRRINELENRVRYLEGLTNSLRPMRPEPPGHDRWPHYDPNIEPYRPPSTTTPWKWPPTWPYDITCKIDK